MKIKTLVTTVALALAMGVSSVQAGRNYNPGVMPPQSHPNGKTYGEWGAVWWQWAMSFPIEVCPIEDPSGASCGLGQLGPVWFLAGTSGDAVQRTCVVPAGKAIFFPIINILNDYPCPDPSFGPAPGQTLEEFLTEGANWYIAHVSELTAEIDGVPLKNLYDYRGTSKLFEFTADPSQVAADPCVTGGPQSGVADGYWIMLAPLKSGQHTIHFTGTWLFTLEEDGFDWTFTVDVTYFLTVQ